MKKIFIVLFALLLAAPIYSQVKFGIKAGASTDFTFTDQTFKNTDVTIQSLKEAEWGFQGGAFMRISLAGLYVQPEFLFATATNSVSYDDVEAGGGPVIYNQKFNKINIPVLVDLKSLS